MAAPRALTIPVADQAPQERGDAARNRTLLLEAARRLIAERGADAVTTDDIAVAAGVGKGTLFRRFGSRAGLMIVLLDEDEKAQQQAFLFGPPPLGPGAPPLERLLAYGRAPAEVRQCPSGAAVGCQPRPSDAVQRPGDAAPPPRLGAAGRRGHHRRPRRAGHRPARAARPRLRTPPTHRGRPDAEDPRRRVGDLGAQALRHE